MAIEERKDLEDLLLRRFESRSKGSCSSSRKPSEFDGNPSLRVKNVTRTIRTLQLDHSQSCWSLVSWIVGFMMILVIPILRLIYVKPADNEASHQRGATKLAKLFIPALILYILQKCWFYIDVPLAPLPHLNNKMANIMIIAVSVSVSWVFQTTTFLYACILFWKVCYLQELKMKLFKEMLLQAYDPEFYYSKYTGIIKCLQSTSRPFRLFLALTGSITIFSALASMYEEVKDCHGIGILLSGELVVLNLVNLTGIGLCLHSASKVAHLHRRIVKAASSMHAKTTFATSKCYISSQWKYQSLEFEEKIQLFSQAQDAWSQRSALGFWLC